MQRSYFQVLSVFLALLSTTTAHAQPPTKRPNVLLIITDDQGYGDLSLHGHPTLKTPHLDKLALQSVRLRNFHVSPTCAPTRSAIMTGRYNNKVGVWHTINGRSMLRAGERTLAEIFAALGYVTGMIGKWHLGDNYPFRPHDRGFKHAFYHGGGGVGQTPDFYGNSYFRDSYFRNGKPEATEGYCTDVWFGEAAKFLEKHQKEPFFLYVAPNAPHFPHRAPKEYLAKYPDAIDAMISNIDDNVGRLLAKLRELGLEENTIVIFMTDNGAQPGRFNAGMRGYKLSAYDGGHRVPCFIRWPGGKLPAGREVPQLAAHIDLLPTLTELCGLDAKAPRPLDGRSLTPLLRGPTEWRERTLVVDNQRLLNLVKHKEYAVMTQRWRLVGNAQKFELFDMDADPGQKNDVRAQHPDVVKTLSADYERWWADVSAGAEVPCRIVLGSPHESPARLSAHDWLGNAAWNQTMVAQGYKQVGHWEVEIAKAGEYEIALHRWAAEVDGPLTGVPKGLDPRAELKLKALPIAVGKLAIADVEQQRAVEPDARAVTFRVRLPAGPTQLRTWFLDAQQQVLGGAYYVYVRRLGD